MSERDVDARIAAHHRALSPAQRFAAAASLFESAGRLVTASLPAGASEEERRRRWIRRIHGDELPAAAIEAYARGANTPARETADQAAPVERSASSPAGAADPEPSAPPSSSRRIISPASAR